MSYPKPFSAWTERAGQKYLPSNGTEGDHFINSFCMNCVHCHPDSNKSPQCEILCHTLSIGKHWAWVFNAEGFPVCTEWKKWDWGNDRDGWNEPPEPEPDDPNQLMIPFDLMFYLGCGDLIITKTAILESI